MLTARQRPYAFIAECVRYIDRKTICFKCIRERRGQADVHLLVRSVSSRGHNPRSSHDRMHFLFTMSKISAVALRATASCLPDKTERPGRVVRRWWSQTGSNRRPHACKARALPTELWPRAARAFRTHAFALEVVGLGRLELPTSRLSSARSNQLSYKPELMTPPGEDNKVHGLGRACPGRKRNEDGGNPA